MTITIDLSPETQRRLEGLAMKNGQDLHTFVRDLLDIVSEKDAQEQGDIESREVHFSTPELIEKGGVHVVRAQAMRGLGNVLQREREKRLDMLGDSLKE